MPEDIKTKISKTIKIKFNTPEWKKKCSLLHKGEKNGMYGKHHSEETKEKISKITREKMQLPEIKKKMCEIWKSEEYIKKLSGRVVSDETKRKLREFMACRVEKYGIHAKSFNPDACVVIDEYGKENGYNFQHALNGGEYHVKGLGYFVDGYDKEKNVVIEIDESRHFDCDGNLKQKDIERQKRIEDYLKCQFIRLPFVKT